MVLIKVQKPSIPIGYMKYIQKWKKYTKRNGQKDENTNFAHFFLAFFSKRSILYIKYYYSYQDTRKMKTMSIA